MIKYIMRCELDQTVLFKDPGPRNPEPGAPVFGPRAEDWHMNACLNYVRPRDQWDWYADGYKLAGDTLVQFVECTQGQEDILVFPIVFNYRQYLELRLKELLIQTAIYMDLPRTFPSGHNLPILWRDFRPMITSAFPNELSLDGIEHVIMQFHEFDAKSYAFRYPVSKDGVTPSLPGVAHINLAQLRDRIAEVAYTLDGASAGISEYIDQKQQHEREMWPEAGSYLEPPDRY